MIIAGLNIHLFINSVNLKITVAHIYELTTCREYEEMLVQTFHQLLQKPYNFNVRYWFRLSANLTLFCYFNPFHHIDNIFFQFCRRILQFTVLRFTDVFKWENILLLVYYAQIMSLYFAFPFILYFDELNRSAHWFKTQYNELQTIEYMEF